MKKNKCVICKRVYIGYGNNSQPVRSGRCCDECNLEIVMPERLKVLKKQVEDDRRSLGW